MHKKANYIQYIYISIQHANNEHKATKLHIQTIEVHIYAFEALTLCVGIPSQQAMLWCQLLTLLTVVIRHS